MICFIALIVFGIISIFSASHRPLAREAIDCMFRRITFRPCVTRMDQRLKGQIIGKLLAKHEGTGRFISKYFEAISWAITIITIVSLFYTAQGIYNYIVYGNCNGPDSNGFCIFQAIGGGQKVPTLIPPKTLDGISKGNASSHLTIVEFGCFTCPFTKNSEPELNAFLAKHPGEYSFIYKPLAISDHPYGFEASEAALCANRQGKFWEYKDLLFANQDAVRTNGIPELKSLAGKVSGMDQAKFDWCLDSGETKADVEKYVQEGKDANIYATPTFFFGNASAVGVLNAQEYERLLNNESITNSNADAPGCHIPTS
ncbi:Thioredoxin [Candidatus Gugararchaeum adminiculabundum]|nr:Thioredoxin [Candidatus Gugararchaeum adminiculabundum]